MYYWNNIFTFGKKWRQIVCEADMAFYFYFFLAGQGSWSDSAAVIVGY